MEPSPTDEQWSSLEKQLNIELKVKAGTENMIASLVHRDRKLVAEAQLMLQDSKAKIEFLKMRMARLKQIRTEMPANGDSKAKGSFLVYNFIYRTDELEFC